MSQATLEAPRRAAVPFRVFAFSRDQAIGFVLLAALIAVLPSVAYPFFLMQVMCFALFACSFNLLLGYAGLMSFGHAAFFGMGSYVAAYAAKSWGLTPELAVLAGGASGAALGSVLGWIAIRRQGLSFAMITLALAQLVAHFCNRVPFTGGEDGIQGVPRGRLLGAVPLADDLRMYVFTAVVFLAGFVLIHRIVHSPFGQVLKAIRENEPRATSLGYRTDDYKLIAFVQASFIAGIAGGTKAIVVGLATLTDVSFQTSGEVVLMTLLGGLGTIFGPVVGASLVRSLDYYLSDFGSYVTVAQGFIFVLCVLLFRRGIVGEIGARLHLKL